jgi:hypothetical protein
VTFSFDTWKEGHIAPSTVEIPVARPEVEKKSVGK